MEPIPEGRASDNRAASAGAWLRNVRQQRGLHIAALAVMLKVPQAKLEALEADRYDELPDATFARALATAMCRALKVDPAPVLALLPRSGTGEFDMRPGLNQPFRERGAGGSMDADVLALLARPVVWGPVLLLAAAAAVYWIPAGWLPERGDNAATPPAPASSAVTGTVAASEPPVQFVAAPTATTAASATVVASPVPVASAPAVPASVPAPAATRAEPVASAPLQVRDVPPPPAAARPASVPAGQALRLTATAETWVEVADAKGQVLLSRVLRAGEQQEFGGSPPYKVRVGNVSGTRIEWRGAPVDLAARASNNVARLELN